MIRSIIDILESTEALHGPKLAYVDDNRGVTYSELKNDSFKIAGEIVADIASGEPVIIYMDKCVECIESFFAVACAGGFYVPVDVTMPEARVQLIQNTLKAKTVLTKGGIVPEGVFEGCRVFDVTKILAGESVKNQQLLKQRRAAFTDTSPVYSIFTSGSTGVPKGVVISHLSLVNFAEWIKEELGFTCEDVLANQAPFYFDASIKDIYGTLISGATMYIVPKRLFSFPKKLIEFLNDHKVTCIMWVPSVLCMVVNFKTLDKIKPLYLKRVGFCGESMPTKQLNMWRRVLPQAKYTNLYGPTEATCDCTCYTLERELEDSEPIPLGKACKNTEVFLLNEQEELVTQPAIPGELCIRGRSLALGYYDDPEKTAKAFVQNPLQKHFPERIYRTGDIAHYNQYGELVFLARKDAQVKHNGYRVELGEVENALQAVEEVARGCCVFHKERKQIIALYVGRIDPAELLAKLKVRLPSYMLPDVCKKLDSLPLNLNGKIDRTALHKMYAE